MPDFVPELNSISCLATHQAEVQTEPSQSPGEGEGLAELWAEGRRDDQSTAESKLLGHKGSSTPSKCPSGAIIPLSQGRARAVPPQKQQGASGAEELVLYRANADPAAASAGPEEGKAALGVSGEQPWN